MEANDPNQTLPAERPIVLCLSGLDPSGGAGIQADIEALFSVGCHAAPVITALTVQDTRNIIKVVDCDPLLIVEQARAVLEDMPVRAVKIGLINSRTMMEVIHTLLQDYADLPVVVDPVLKAGGGYSLSNQELVTAFRTLLLPRATIITPNSYELAELTNQSDNLDASAAELLDTGCQHVLLTGTHLDEQQVVNRLYSEHLQMRSQSWPRLQGEFHGSGCTLAAALAGFLAHGFSVNEAVSQAQHYTWHTLKHATRPGCGQLVPHRGYWQQQQGKPGV